MPLTATFDPGHNRYPNENVYFFINDRDRRVRCGVSELALESSTRKEGRLLAFSKYRPHIERLRVRSMIESKWRRARSGSAADSGHVQAKPAGATITRIPQGSP
jgi:hypothetical protein